MAWLGAWLQLTAAYQGNIINGFVPLFYSERMINIQNSQTWLDATGGEFQLFRIYSSGEDIILVVSAANIKIFLIEC